MKRKTIHYCPCSTGLVNKEKRTILIVLRYKIVVNTLLFQTTLLVFSVFCHARIVNYRKQLGSTVCMQNIENSIKTANGAFSKLFKKENRNKEKRAGL